MTTKPKTHEIFKPQLVSIQSLCSQFGFRWRGRYYELAKEGLLPPAVKIGVRSVAVPQSEIDEVIAARIAERDEDQIRALVARLVAARQNGVRS